MSCVIVNICSADLEFSGWDPGAALSSIPLSHNGQGSVGHQTRNYTSRPVLSFNFPKVKGNPLPHNVIEFEELKGEICFYLLRIYL